MNSNKLSESISKEIIKTSLDMGIEYSEIAIDEIINGILKEIPLVKTIFSFGKLGYSVKELFFIKKLLTFLKEFHSNSINQNKLIEFQNKLDIDTKFKTKVIENIMIYTDAFLHIEKSKIFANLFREYINGKYDWNYFLGLADCLNSINISAFDFLEEMSKIEYEIAEEPEKRKIERNGEKEALLYSCGIAYEKSPWSSSFNISQLGKDLYKYGIKKNIS